MRRNSLIHNLVDGGAILRPGGDGLCQALLGASKPPNGVCNHLVLPLARHNFRVDARDGDVREHASAVVRFSHAAAVGILESDGAVVRTLWSGLAVLGPSERRHLLDAVRRKGHADFNARYRRLFVL